MRNYLELSKEALARAEAACDSGEIPKENMFLLAPIFYAEVNKTNNNALLKQITQEIEDIVYEDWKHPKSKEQYKFHFVSSFLYGYVVAGKIDEFKYDEIMEYVNDRMDLFNADYGE